MKIKNIWNHHLEDLLRRGVEKIHSQPEARPNPIIHLSHHAEIEPAAGMAIQQKEQQGKGDLKAAVKLSIHTLP